MREKETIFSYVNFLNMCFFFAVEVLEDIKQNFHYFPTVIRLMLEL
jgi:hypothetical protein